MCHFVNYRIHLRIIPIIISIENIVFSLFHLNQFIQLDKKVCENKWKEDMLGIEGREEREGGIKCYKQ